MINQIFDNFERSEFSDDIFSIFGRALSVATRFDTSCKALARFPSYKISILGKHMLSDVEYAEVATNISNSYKNLNRAIDSLKLGDDIKQVLTKVREARNELIHEATIGACNGFDGIGSSELSDRLNHIESLVHQVIKGDALISTILSIHNKEPISEYPFSKLYEEKYLKWVMERFET